jgi:hypothetical protein
MQEKLQNIEKKFLENLEKINSREELQNLEAEILGKK